MILYDSVCTKPNHNIFCLKNVVITIKPGVITFSFFNPLKNTIQYKTVRLLESYSFILTNKKHHLLPLHFKNLRAPNAHEKAILL